MNNVVEKGKYKRDRVTSLAIFQKKDNMNNSMENGKYKTQRDSVTRIKFSWEGKYEERHVKRKIKNKKGIVSRG